LRVDYRDGSGNQSSARALAVECEERHLRSEENPAVEKSITVYGTTWCGDTTRARRLLESLGVAYAWIDIDEDREGEAFVKTTNRGSRSVPTIVFADGTALTEPSGAQLTAKLRETGKA
jgi:mycoredoxin